MEKKVSYEGMYVKLRGDPTFWAVDGWRRRAMRSMDEVMALGLRPVVTVSEEVLEGIPVVVEAPSPGPSPEYRGGGEDVKGEGEG